MRERETSQHCKERAMKSGIDVSRDCCVQREIDGRMSDVQ